MINSMKKIFSSGYIGSDIAGTQYDATTANWGSPWQMPSLTQIEELLNKNNCTSTWTTQNGVDGRKFTGKNGGTIFLPAAGERWKNNLEFEGACGLPCNYSINITELSHLWKACCELPSRHSPLKGRGRGGVLWSACPK